MSGGGGGGGDITSYTYTNLIPDYIPGFQEWTEEYLETAASMQAVGVFLPYTGQTYADQNADETDGIAAVAVRGRLGSQVELDGKAHLRDLYDGLKINQNSKLAAFIDAKLEELLEDLDWEILPSILNKHSFSFGGSEHNVDEAKAAAAMMRRINEIARAYYEDYKHERGLQEAGMSHATPYGLQCIRDMEMLRQAGVYVREYNQGSLNDEWQKFNEAVTLPVRNLDILGNAVRTIMSTARMAQETYYKPPEWAQIAGMALTGIGLYQMFAGTSVNPYSNPFARAEASAAQSGVSLAGNPMYQLGSPGQWTTF